MSHFNFMIVRDVIARRVRGSPDEAIPHRISIALPSGRLLRAKKVALAMTINSIGIMKVCDPYKINDK